MKYILTSVELLLDLHEAVHITLVLAIAFHSRKEAHLYWPYQIIQYLNLFNLIINRSCHLGLIVRMSV